MEEEDDNDNWDTVQDSTGFSREEEVAAAEPAALESEDALSRVAAAAEVLAWVAGVGPSRTSLQSFSLLSRH